MHLTVLRMLSEYVGEDKFLKGVSIYLKNHLYANSEPVDLWNGIAEATGIDVAKMMDNWVWKIGFPVITVKEQDGKIHLRQDRFLASGDPTEEENQTLWYTDHHSELKLDCCSQYSVFNRYIPLSVLSTDASGKTSVDRTAVLQEREITLDIDIKKPWKLNAGTSGVCTYSINLSIGSCIRLLTRNTLVRVAYEPERLKRLGEWAAQKDSVFSLEDRMGLVSDAMVLAQSGAGKTSAALDLIASLHKEEESESSLSFISTKG